MSEPANIKSKKQPKTQPPRISFQVPYRDGKLGLFNSLPLEIITMIFLNLQAKERAQCCIGVCKSWRSLLDYAPLWRSIGPNICSNVIPKIPRGCVSHFSLSSNVQRGSASRSKHCVDVLIQNNHHPQSICLSGTAITVKVARALRPILGKDLQSLEIMAVHRSLNVKTCTPIIQEAVNIKHLILGFDAPLNLHEMREFLKPFGNSLKTLRVCNRYFSQPDLILKELGILCPNLETIIFETLRISDPVTSPLIIAPLPKLKRLAVYNLVNSCVSYEPRQLSGLTVTAFLDSLLKSCKNIDTLVFSRGKESVISGRNMPKPPQSELPILDQLTVHEMPNLTNVVFGFIKMSPEFVKDMFMKAPLIDRISTYDSALTSTCSSVEQNDK
jgi:hypothetical protein